MAVRSLSHTLTRLALCLAVILGALGAPNAAPAAAQPWQGRAHAPRAVSAALASPQAPQAPAAPLGPFPLFLPVVKTPPNITRTVIPVTGGTANLAGGKVQLIFPANAASGAITVLSQALPFNPPTGLYAGSPAMDLQAQDALGSPITQFSKEVTVRFYYDPSPYWIKPEYSVVTNSNGSWGAAGTWYTQGQNAVEAHVFHFSQYAMVSVDQAGYNRMTGDGSGGVFYADDFNAVYRISPGSTTPVLYADLSATLGYGGTCGGTCGGLARDPASGDLFIGTSAAVYRLTPGKTLTQLFLNVNWNLGNYIYSVHYSPAYQAIFTSGVYGANQYDAASGAWVRSLSMGGSGIAVDSKKRIFGMEKGMIRISHATPFNPPGISSLTIWPDIANAPDTRIDILGFLGARHIAVDDSDNVYIPNPLANTISVVSGDDPVVTGAIYNLPAPANVVVSGSTLVVSTQGGLISVPLSRRDISPFSPKVMNQSLSGQGSAVVIYGGDPVPANNVLRVNGKVVRDLWNSSIPLRYTSYNLEWYIYDLWTTSALEPYNTPVRQAAVSIGSQTFNATVALPERGNWDYVDIYAQATIARGMWGVFMQSAGVTSQERLFDEWRSGDGKGGNQLYYQFNKIGVYHFVVDSPASNTANGITITVTPDGEMPDPGWCQSSVGGGSINPAQGARWRYRGASLEIPPGALPGAAPYQIAISRCNQPYPGKDAVTQYGAKYEYTLTPEPTSLGGAITLRLPYDTALAKPPVGAFFDPAIDDATPLPYTLANGLVNITLPAGSYANGIPGSADPPASAEPTGSPALPAGVLGRLGTILKGVWWAVGLPNSLTATTNFIIYYNTNDATPAYAASLLADLEYARTKLAAESFSMPLLPVLVKIAPWIAAKSRPGATVGTDGKYHLFFNNALASDYLEDTTAHEVMHLSQHESIGALMFPLTSNWWLEGTATWAQYFIHPGNTSYLNDISGSLDFPNTPFDNWGGLSVEQQYATMALDVYLVKNNGASIIESTNLYLKSGYTFRGALSAAIGENWNAFYKRWAKDYWTQAYDPVTSWSFDPVALTVVRPNAPKNNMFANPTRLSLTSGMVKAFYDPALPGLPPAFTSGVDSVVRVPNSCANTQVIVYDKGKVVNKEFIGPVPADEVQAFRTVSSYSSSSPLYFIYINSGDNQCSLQVVWEAPNITNLSTNTIAKNTPVQIVITGAGFGPNAGTVFAGGQTYPANSWTETSVNFDLPAQSTPGTITIRVQTPSGALSNSLTLTITN